MVEKSILIGWTTLKCFKGLVQIPKFHILRKWYQSCSTLRALEGTGSVAPWGQVSPSYGDDQNGFQVKIYDYKS